MLKKNFFLLIHFSFFTFHFSLLSFANSPTIDSVAVKYSQYITAGNLSIDLHKLASDEFEGRETGTTGQKLAAAFIAQHFFNAGFLPCTDSTYFQRYPISVKYPEGVTIESNKKTYELLKDFYYLPGIDDTLIKSKNFVFLGYGINEKNYSDFNSHVDVRGKILIVLSGEPERENGISFITNKKNPSDWTTNWKKKIQYLKEYSPLAILIVVASVEDNVKILNHSIKSPTLKLATAPDNVGTSIPYFYISKSLANTILSPSGKVIENLKKKISKKGKQASFEFKSEIKLDIHRKEGKMQAENVLGFLEGSDNKLKSELVVVSAHYDHLGRDEDKIYFGADDDGSGTSAVMEMAKAFKKAHNDGKGPKRSMLFITFSGEEKGLLGSQYYSEHPFFPLKNTIADLNIDMIGRIDEKHSGNPDYIYLIGSDRLSAELNEISENVNKSSFNLELDYTYNKADDPNRFYFRSDHYNFAKNNVPVIFYFNGIHADYHKPTDTVEKINFNKMEKITRLVFFTAWELANRANRIKLDSE